MRALTPLTVLTLLLTVSTTLVTAAPALAGTDETPGGSSAVGFPIIMGILAVVAAVVAVVWKLVVQRKQK